MAPAAEPLSEMRAPFCGEMHFLPQIASLSLPPSLPAQVPPLLKELQSLASSLKAGPRVELLRSVVSQLEAGLLQGMTQPTSKFPEKSCRVGMATITRRCWAEEWGWECGRGGWGAEGVEPPPQYVPCYACSAFMQEFPLPVVNY